MGCLPWWLDTLYQPLWALLPLPQHYHTGHSTAIDCHETMARAARLERRVLVTLIRPVSNVQFFQGFLHDILIGFATLLQMKGLKGFVRGEAW